MISWMSLRIFFSLSVSFICSTSGQTSVPVIGFPNSDFQASGSECTYGDGIKGRCESRSLCRIQNGGFVKIESQPEVCQNEEVCCRRPYDIAGDFCDSWSNYWRLNGGQCIEDKPLIVGGEEANVGQFPEIGLIGREDSEGTIFWQCGGTLISPHFVLTAAHCVLKISTYVMRFGEHDRFRHDNRPILRIAGSIPKGIYGMSELQSERRNVVSTQQHVSVRRIIFHPNYTRPYNDIALLELKRPVVFTRRVLPACLPSDPHDEYGDIEVTSAGWGKLGYNKKRLSRTLQKVKYSVIDRRTCENRLVALSPDLIPLGIQQTQMCSGGPGKDTCKGDSGGPVVAQITNKQNPCEHTLLGIVSVGYGCNDFGVNTRVASYIDWIVEHIAPEAMPVRTRS